MWIRISLIWIRIFDWPREKKTNPDPDRENTKFLKTVYPIKIMMLQKKTYYALYCYLYTKVLYQCSKIWCYGDFCRFYASFPWIWLIFWYPDPDPYQWSGKPKCCGSGSGSTSRVESTKKNYSYPSPPLFSLQMHLKNNRFIIWNREH